MKTKILFSSLLLLALFIGLSFSAQAASSFQAGQFQTPTAGPDGRIIYIIQEGDTCSRIELLFGVSINELRTLNPNLNDDCTVIPGEELMVGMGGPAVAPTSTPNGILSTPTEILATPTPFKGTTEICVILFNDINGDAIRQEGELGLDSGAISVTNNSGGYSQTRDSLNEIDINTDEPAYICFGEKPPEFDEVPESEKLPAGKYTVSAAIPDGYNPTSNLSYSLEVFAGERAFVGFGAQSKASTPEEVQEKEAEEDGGSSILLGLLGAILLLGGGGLAWYAMRMNKSSTENMRY